MFSATRRLQREDGDSARRQIGGRGRGGRGSGGTGGGSCRDRNDRRGCHNSSCSILSPTVRKVYGPSALCLLLLASVDFHLLFLLPPLSPLPGSLSLSSPLESLPPSRSPGLSQVIYLVGKLIETHDNGFFPYLEELLPWFLDKLGDHSHIAFKVLPSSPRFSLLPSSPLVLSLLLPSSPPVFSILLPSCLPHSPRSGWAWR